jgi:ADP-heptose:LPS heptosyltransferase
MHHADTLFGCAWLRGAALRADDFRPGTPLRHFFAWNERARRPDRRYIIANDLHRLLTSLGSNVTAREICVAHLALHPVIRARFRDRLLISRCAVAEAADGFGMSSGAPAVAAGRRLVEDLVAAIGASETAVHAAVFAAFEALGDAVDLAALARLRHMQASPFRGPRPRRILVIRLSAFGDFVQSLGPVEAIRRHHSGDLIALLTTEPFADFARQLGLFDEVLVDRRPASADLRGWIALRRTLRMGGFDRVYDLQTSQRSSAYRRLFDAKRPPEWSGIAVGASHPHANLDRDWQHTIDKQAEQLLMAGIYPTPLPRLPAFDCAPTVPTDRDLVLFAPGSSPHRRAKRWPAAHFGALAQALDAAGYRPIVVGAGGEEDLSAAIRSYCPAAVDLVGRTSIAALGALAQRAVLTVGNDNGVSHLAAAADCPVVVLFSETGSDPARCAPRGRLVRILTVPDLDALPVETVLADVLAILRHLAEAAGDPRSVAHTT